MLHVVLLFGLAQAIYQSVKTDEGAIYAIPTLKSTRTLGFAETKKNAISIKGKDYIPSCSASKIHETECNCVIYSGPVVLNCLLGGAYPKLKQYEKTCYLLVDESAPEFKCYPVAREFYEEYL